jgi:hypothetical protein
VVQELGRRESVVQGLGRRESVMQELELRESELRVWVLVVVGLVREQEWALVG